MYSYRCHTGGYMTDNKDGFF